ncbi:hypothetical protein IQ254_29805, partial [Nodosilinea sp. LEGE 07088]
MKSQSVLYLGKELNLSFTATNSVSTSTFENGSGYLLTLQSELSVYYAVEVKEGFNLKPAVRNPLTNGEFQPDRPIQLELALKPELLPRLLEHASTAEEALEYLVNLSEEHEERLGSGGA